MYFITYANKKYFPILFYLLKSLQIYSKYKIIVYTIDDELPENFNFENILEKKMIKSNNKHIWLNKFTIILESLKKYDNCIFIDADTIVNYSIDKVFEYCNTVNTIPLLSLHPSHKKSLKKAKKWIKFNFPIVKKWGHSDLIWYNKKCINFFKKCIEIANKKYGIGDEIVINYLQNKYKLTKNIPYMTSYFEIYKSYINNNQSLIINDLKNSEVKELYLHLFHGCKNTLKCKEILDKLVEFNDKNKNSNIYFNLLFLMQ